MTFWYKDFGRHCIFIFLLFVWIIYSAFNSIQQIATNAIQWGIFFFHFHRFSTMKTVHTHTTSNLSISSTICSNKIRRFRLLSKFLSRKLKIKAYLSGQWVIKSYLFYWYIQRHNKNSIEPDIFETRSIDLYMAFAMIFFFFFVSLSIFFLETKCVNLATMTIKCDFLKGKGSV